MQPQFKLRNLWDLCGAPEYPVRRASDITPIDEIDGPTITSMVTEYRERRKIFAYFPWNGAAGFHFDDSVILTYSGLVNEQVWFGRPAPPKIWVLSFVYLPVQPVSAIRPSQPHLVVKLITIDALSINRVITVNRQKEILWRNCRRCGLENLCKMLHDGPQITIRRRAAKFHIVVPAR